MSTSDNADRSAGAVATPAPMAPRRPKPARSFSFVLAVVLGILVLWVAGLGAVLAETGDCFGPDDECRPYWDAQVVHARVLFAMVVGLSVLGLLAIAVGRRVFPAALLIASVTTLVAGFGAGSWAQPWVPNGVGLVMLPAAVLALASAGQLIDQIVWRPRWLRTWLGE